jgi:hypothetical protein
VPFIGHCWVQFRTIKGVFMFQTFKSKAKYAALIPVIAVGNAMATLPASVQADLDAAKADVGTIGAAVLLIAIAILAFKMLRKGAN